VPILNYEDQINGYLKFDMNIVQTAYEFSEFSIPDNKTDFNCEHEFNNIDLNNNQFIAGDLM